MSTPSIVDLMGLSEKQLASVLDRGRDQALVAGAGSGKTRTLVARYLGLLESGHELRQIVAITFTDKAAREMRNRVREQIRRYLVDVALDEPTRSQWQERYEMLNSARISTIHALCAQILRMHPAEAEIDPRFEVLLEVEQNRLVSTSIEEALSWVVMQEDLVPLLQAVGVQGLRDLLETAFRQRGHIAAYLDTDGISSWDRWSDAIMSQLDTAFADPRYSAAIAHFRELERQGHIAAALAKGDKLAAGLRTALDSVVDLDAAYVERDWPRVLNKLKTVSGAYQRNWGAATKWRVPPPKPSARDLADWCDELLSSFGDRKKLDPERDRQIAPLIAPLQRVITRVLETYASAKGARGALDFDDLQHLAIELLRDHADVRAYWQNQVSAILVDEFQDTNQLQRDLVALLNNESRAGQHPESVSQTAGKLFIVGDAKQSIYRFRGADVQVFREERERIRKRGGAYYKLDTSYRGHAHLIQGLNDLLGATLADKEDPRFPYVEPFSPLVPFREEAPSGLEAPYIEWHLALGTKTGGGDQRAATAIADRLAQLVRTRTIWLEQGGKKRLLDYGDIAVLCRKRSAFAAYEAAFEQAGIPYVTVSGGGFYDRPEVRDLVNLLRAVADVDDDLALAGALRSPAFAVPDTGLYALCAWQREKKGEEDQAVSLWDAVQAVAEGQSVDILDEATRGRLVRAYRLVSDWRAGVHRIPVARLLKRIVDATHYRALLIGAGESRAVRNLDKLLADAQTLDLVSVPAFLEYVDLLNDVGAREGEARTVSEGAAQIMTVHAAKGLEFPVVVLGDFGASSSNHSDPLILDEELGMVPKPHAADGNSVVYSLAANRAGAADEEESRRILYVAATRAREMLLVSANAKLSAKGNLRTEGWLTWWAEATGLKDQAIPADLSAPVRYRLAIGRTAIDCVVYPETYVSRRSGDTLAQEQDIPRRLPPLLAPVPTDESVEEDAHTPDRSIHRVVVATPSRAPSWVVGKVVHDALAQWRFPGEGFAPWAKGISQEYASLPVPAQDDLVRRAARLLESFCAQPLYKRMEASSALHHELPYSLERNGRLENGRLDALFLDQDQVWHIVEFKTDEMRGTESVQQILERDSGRYLAQIQRYASAMRELLGSEPRVSLVFLDLTGVAHVVNVPPCEDDTRGF